MPIICTLVLARPATNGHYVSHEERTGPETLRFFRNLSHPSTISDEAFEAIAAGA